MSVNAKEEIEAERRRQIEAEGWSPEHDDEHRDGEMLDAAVIYLHHGTDKAATSARADGVPIGWPWGAQWWKPKDRRRNLVRAGALCLAEKERLERAGLPSAHVDHKLAIAVRELESI